MPALLIRYSSRSRPCIPFNTKNPGQSTLFVEVGGFVNGVGNELIIDVNL